MPATATGKCGVAIFSIGRLPLRISAKATAGGNQPLRVQRRNACHGACAESRLGAADIEEIGSRQIGLRHAVDHDAPNPCMFISHACSSSSLNKDRKFLRASPGCRILLEVFKLDRSSPTTISPTMPNS